MNLVELFSGSGTIAKEFRQHNHKTFTVDIRRRKGVCEPDLKKDILKLTRKDIPFKKIDVLWLSPPCDVWSYAAGNFHWNPDNTPKTEKCLNHTKLLLKSLALIQELRSTYFFIENPRGRLRSYPALKLFLAMNSAGRKELTYSSYGFQTIKPTNIFTNALDWIPRPMDPYGRGAKNKCNFDNLTKCQRQKVPRPLARELREYCEYKLCPKNTTTTPNRKKE